jgi:hypothetical protein
MKQVSKKIIVQRTSQIMIILGQTTAKKIICSNNKLINFELCFHELAAAAQITSWDPIS